MPNQTTASPSDIHGIAQVEADRKRLGITWEMILQRVEESTKKPF